MSDQPDTAITWDQIREYLNLTAIKHGEWAGLPMPIDGISLVIEPRHPFSELNGCKLSEDEEQSSTEASGRLPKNWKMLRNLRDGRDIGLRNGHMIQTLRVAYSPAWTIEAETKALELLSNLIAPRAYQSYFLSGTFLETSKRSHVTYVFRKGRPTLALRPGNDGYMRVIAALCMHPIGYYEGSWAGVMVPTDETIAHLTMMRGDERKYWSKCNQHSAASPQAGI